MRRFFACCIMIACTLGASRAAFGSFSEPTPGAGIRMPQAVSPPSATLPAPAPAVYPIFDRGRDVTSTRSGDTAPQGGPRMAQADGRPNAWGQPATPPSKTQHWTGSPFWTTSGSLLLGLLGLIPLLWMRRAARDSDVPHDVRARLWRGWTSRPRKH